MAKIKVQNHILNLLFQKKAAYTEDIIAYVKNYVDPLEKITLSYKVHRTLKKLADNGDISLQSLGGRTFAFITREGRHKHRSLQLSSDTGMMSMAWDGRWRIVMLDVPEQDKEKRNALRYILKKAGFVCLKNAVWISPHPFEHMLDRMKQDLGLTHELMIIVSNTLDAQTELEFRKSFWGIFE
ncbi:MAG: hypothetical protein LRY41_01485 [Candidatus Pacebacteria bacterium]|nr:hypothetical protein [Candidatus Paceibacterota bacterium]MCD8507958.1 hypothetical protein [Candidatus Paceibacterota bacterium]MCD8527985.1 hypothetical protein [Candidatus Paceibacterota bacterium]MCD8563635.1 hypothetical protein [Candidatus Paceibacterota bacterium]